MSTTAIVILNWNGEEFIKKFLPILVQNTMQEGVSIVIADNGSSDNSVHWISENYPKIRIIKFDENHGFTGGYNRALAQIDTDYYILLNSDIEVSNNWVAPLIEAMEIEPEIGVCMPKILSYSSRDYFEYAGGAGGFIDYLGYPFCRGRILSHIEQDTGQYDDKCDVFWATGAAMVVRSSLYRELGGLDESFFAHMEEIDFCWRAKLLGWRVVCLPQSVVYHVGGGALPNNSPKKLFLNYRNNLLMLYKNLPDKNRGTILYTRMFLDGLSALVYLIQGKPSYCKSVFLAHQEYRKLRKRIVRKENKETSHIYRRSIILFFILHRSRSLFSGINKKHIV